MTNSPLSHFLIDGFPRNKDNEEAWHEVIPASVANVRFCLFLDCPESVQEERILGRAAVSNRDDDNVASLKKRFATYNNETVPVLERFRATGKLRRVAADQAPEQVYADVRKIFLEEFGPEALRSSSN